MPKDLPPLAPTPGAVKAQPALDLLDEAFHRLRLAPLGVLGIYYAGTLPFILALLYFVADQAHSADARSRAVGGTLLVSALFFVMKLGHAIFTARLAALVRRNEFVGWDWTRLGRMAATQIILQPSGLFLVTLASIPMIPLPWVYAFYQNITILGDGTLPTRTVLRRAGEAALRWPKQNNLGLTLLSLLGFFVILNLLIAMLGVPYLLRMFTGEENLFTRAGLHIFNTTFFAVLFGLAYLALDPVCKAFYTLRCFYEESLRSGDDLLSELAALPPVNAPGSAPVASAGKRAGAAGLPRVAAGTAAVWLLAMGLSLCMVRSAGAVEDSGAVTALPAPTVAPGRAVSPPELRRSIQEVLSQRKFAWRIPRKESTEADGPLDSLFKGISHWLSDRWTTVKGWLEAFNRWFRNWFKGKEEVDDESSHSGGILNAATLRWLLIALAAVLVGTILYVSGQEWRRRRSAAVAGRSAPDGPVPRPDLTEDTVLATQLPEDEWLRLAEKLLQQGERRLALRAYYLSGLSNLAARGLLGIARHKSNRDYLVELRRRAREQPELQGAFARNVARFERVWYGAHPADDALLTEFQTDRRAM